MLKYLLAMVLAVVLGSSSFAQDGATPVVPESHPQPQNQQQVTITFDRSEVEMIYNTLLTYSQPPANVIGVLVKLQKAVQALPPQATK